MDTFFVTGKAKSARGFAMMQLFVLDKGFIKVYGMTSVKQIPQAMKMFGKEVGDVLEKEDKEDEEMVKQVGRKVVMVIIMCPVRSGTTQQAYTVHGQ